ncbi:Cytochrome c551 peroxidase precursor [Gemmata sp. SH-PL17]|uniref:cytochrome c peroxidase n=1 Tax=Gemmata sp. SH-PL17 TaxID=1630693 RepID=UPI0004AD2924|nr:cytochrome c peroxidase [Gemmata sp. SH-PL17]AMV25709.1 Cytochrome c551 peroxidase precursor [Gemmata sp. SH-PL17]
MRWCVVPLVAVLSLVAPSELIAAPPEARKLALPETPYKYADPKLPANFEERWVKALDTTPADNPTTDAGAALGRALFYDTRLSASDTVSCGTCHIQQNAFAEPRKVSVGHEGRRGDRNAMSLVNLRFARAGLFWDERAETLEEAVGLPVRSRIEMAGRDGPALLKALAVDARYGALFKAAFGTTEVTDERVRKALAQFIRSMVSCDSKYDRSASKVASVKDEFPNFTEEENRGKAVFLQHCNLCHHIGEGKHVAFFDMFRSLNNGLDPDANVLDGGRGDVTLNPTEVGQFRASSLRNVAVTGPYMHDGRFDTLEAVIAFYSTGVMRHPNAGAVGRFGFSAKDQSALVAFLKTLTDETFLTDPKFSDPWAGDAKPSAKLPLPAVAKSAEPKKRESVADRLARGVGLEAGEALPWLKGLDKNGDGTLDKGELEPLLAVLVKTRVGSLSLERGPRGGGGPAPKGPRPGAKGDTLLGDFDGDGTVDENESRAFGAMKRLTELGDGDGLRRLVRTDRFLGGFELTTDRAEAARKVLNAGRTDLARRVLALDLDTLGKMEKLTGADAVARYQGLVIDQQVAAVRTRTARDPDPRPVVERQVAQFDKNNDGQFSPDELTELATALDRLAGGFGCAAPEAIDMAQFTRRFVAYDPAGKGSVAVAKLPERLVDFAVRGDRNRDGILSPAEIDGFIRTSAFGQLLSEGIYVGGGFADALVRHADLVDELELPDETRKAVEELFAEHNRKLTVMKNETVADQFAKFRDAVGKKAPLAAKR